MHGGFKHFSCKGQAVMMLHALMFIVFLNIHLYSRYYYLATEISSRSECFRNSVVFQGKKKAQKVNKKLAAHFSETASFLFTLCKTFYL